MIQKSEGQTKGWTNISNTTEKKCYACKAHAHPHTRTHAHTHTHTHTHSRTDTDIHTHTHTHTRTQAHTHTHTNLGSAPERGPPRLLISEMMNVLCEGLPPVPYNT